MIIYEVDFEKYKKEKNIKSQENNGPAEIINLEDCVFPYLKKACDLFNQGKLLQSAYFFNIVQCSDSKNAYSKMIDVSLLGLIQFKLSNFDLAQKYYLKSLSLKWSSSVALMLYQNSVHSNNFKLAHKIKKLIQNLEGENKPTFYSLSQVNKMNQVLFDKNFNIDLLLSNLVKFKNLNEEYIGVLSVESLLEVIDRDNPYLYLIKKDEEKGIKRNYPIKFNRRLARERIDSVVDFTQNDASSFENFDTKGLIRLLFENCDYLQFNDLLEKLLHKTNCPNNILWQCEDCLFRSDNEKNKFVAMKKLILNERYDKKKISIFYKENIYEILGLDEIRQISKFSKKLANSICDAIQDLIIIKHSQGVEDFFFTISFKNICNIMLSKIEKEKLNIQNLNYLELVDCFIVAFFNENNMQKTKLVEEKSKNSANLIKKFDLEFNKANISLKKDNIYILSCKNND